MKAAIERISTQSVQTWHVLAWDTCLSNIHKSSFLQTLGIRIIAKLPVRSIGRRDTGASANQRGHFYLAQTGHFYLGITPSLRSLGRYGSVLRQRCVRSSADS